jgi:four helix bundle protein
VGVRDFRKIMAWEKADDLVVLIYEVSKAFPKEERYGLTSQLRRAVVSVAANIAEGSGKQYLKEFRQFLYTARASLSEVEYYVHLSHRLGYLNGEKAGKLEESRQETAKILQGFINAVEKQIQQGRIHN